jgi:hypothetical protein
VVPHLGSAIVPSHPTLYRLNMWSSLVRRKGTTQVMYTAKLKDGPKRVKKKNQWFWKGFLKWSDGGGENGITSKRIFEDEVSFSSQIVNFPFIWRDFWSSFFLLRLLRTWGFRWYLRRKSLLPKPFSNGFNILVEDAYSGMELWTPTRLNHDYGDGGVMDILAVDAYFGVDVCTTMFMGEASN